jgi:exportin-T
MQICVRYSSFFEKHTRYITSVLEHFLKLVHHPIMKVKTKAWYLFQRFVRLLRLHVGPLAETVIHNLSDLLMIKAEPPTEADGDEMSSEDLDSSADTIFTSQLYLFEAVGSICGASSVPIDKQIQLCQSVMLPIFSDMEQTLPAARSSDEHAILQIHHDIMALGTFARGFSDWAPISTLSNNPPAPDVQAVFGRVAEATLVALESLKTFFSIRTAARFAFSRLIGVLGSRILPQLPRWIDGLLTQSSTNDEVALFLRLLDQVIFAFKSDIYGFLDTLFTGLLQRVFSGLNTQATGTDDEIQLAELKREYLNFLLVILNNDLGSVIVSGNNQPFFDTLVGTIEHFTKDEEDYPTAKMAFQVLVKMCSTWGGPDVVPVAGQTNGSTPVPQPALPGLDRFMITRFSPLCWVLPATESFNAQDAQARLVLGEAANLQKIIYTKTGQEYLSWLRDNELRSMGMNDDMINDYLSKMTGLDTKGFRTYFQTFVGEAGSA